MARKPVAYWDYIKVEELLSLQGGIESSCSKITNDEVMFITIHQIDELWFKLILREMVSVRDLFALPRVEEQALAAAVRGLRRIEALLVQVSAHFSLMETMTTRDYLAFRDKLSPASGFQSAQLREIEILLGLSDSERIPLGHEGSYFAALKAADGSASPAQRRVEARLGDTPSLKAAIEDWLYRTPIQGSLPTSADDAARVAAFVNSYLAVHAKACDRARELATTDALTPADEERLDKRYKTEKEGAAAFLRAEEVAEADRARASRLRAALLFIESYREVPLLAWPREILDTVVAIEQAFVIFRQRHARMVERIIGRRTGTGGSAGVDYLDQTALKYRVFREVWAVRTLLVQKSMLPPLENPEFYGFASDQPSSS
jgi:tryptophan 2,3-dioxygenase